MFKDEWLNMLQEAKKAIKKEDYKLAFSILFTLKEQLHSHIIENLVNDDEPTRHLGDFNNQG